MEFIDNIQNIIHNVHIILDRYNNAFELPLSEMVEYSTLSSMIGNIFRIELVKQSNLEFISNKPNSYPDLIGKNFNIEIKMAMDMNYPKAHKINEGYYLIARYVLCDKDEKLNRGNKNRGIERGINPRIWQVKYGFLSFYHFNEYKTTVNISKNGMDSLQTIYYNKTISPEVR